MPQRSPETFKSLDNSLSISSYFWGFGKVKAEGRVTRLKVDGYNIYEMVYNEPTLLTALILIRIVLSWGFFVF